MFVRHCNRKAYQIEFVRCRDCNYCNNLPLRENDFLTVMRNFGDTLPVPEASIHKDHYKSLDDMLRMTGLPQKILCQIPGLSRIFKDFFSLFPGLLHSNFQDFSRTYLEIPGLSRTF